MVQVHFTLDHIKDMRDQRNSKMDENLHGIVHGIKWIMFHGLLLDIVLGPS